MGQDPYLRLEKDIAAWSQRRQDILAIVIIGSRGRPAGSPDARSDLDLILFCQQPGRYQESNAWLSEFGRVWIAALNAIGPGDPEWMVYFAPGLKVDFLLVDASPGQPLADMLASLPYQQVLDRGYRILYRSPDTNGKQVMTAARPLERTPPSEWDFHQKVNATLFTAERFVKFAIRNDHWRSRYTFEAELKDHLLAFIQWHAQTGAEPPADTWYEGRNMVDWADRRVITAIRTLDAGHRLPQQRAALLSFLDLFQMLAREIAERLGHDFPTDGQREMMAWLAAALPGETG